MNTKALRQKILDLAIRGKLVPQNPNDEPASVLLDRIRAEKQRLVKEGKIKRSKKNATSNTPHYEQDVPFEVPKGWCWTSLEDYTKDITDFVASGSFASLRENVQYYSEENYAILIRTKDFQTKFAQDLIYTDEHGYEFLKNSRLFGGELILPNIGASIGKAFIVPKLGKRMTLAPNSILLRTTHEIETRWLYIYFTSKIGIDTLLSISSSSAQGKFNKTDLRNVVIPIPPIAELNRIIDSVELWSNRISEIESGKTDLERLISQTKSKILDLAIRGKLVEQDKNDEPASELLKRINPDWQPSDTSHYPYKLPESWFAVRIGDIFNHNSGKALNSSNKEGLLMDYITTSNLYWDKFELTTLKQMYYKESEIEKYSAIKGDLLVCEGGDIGRAAIWNYEYPICIQNHIHKLRPKADLSVKFYYYIFMLYKMRDMIGGKGIAIQGLSSNELHNLIVPLPPLPEQHRIVAKIEELFATLDSISQALAD